MQLERTALISLLALATAALPAHAAKSVEVSFVDPTHFSDAGKDPVDARRNEDTLARFLEGLGERYLGPDQALKIEILDLDLAGTVRPSRRGNGDIRILRGGADVPRIKLRYSLVAGGQVAKSGEETVTDLDYSAHRPDVATDDPLRREKQLLSDWFKGRFGPGKAAG